MPDALTIVDEIFSEQLGENSPVTERGYYDPDGINSDLYGIFDDSDSKGNKDGGNTYQKQGGPRFIVKSVPTFNINENKELSLPNRRATNYVIRSIFKDDNGAQVLWLI